MGAWAMLDQLLKSGADALGQGLSPQPGGQGWDKKSLATGAAAGGALALLLGSRRGRQIGGKALKIGGVAALGALAYQAYSRYQQEQQNQQAAASAPRTSAPAGGLTPTAAPDLAALPAPEREQHGQAMLKAMIAAAKSDGHMDERERGLVEAELTRLDADPALRQWVEGELRKPIDPADVASAAATPQGAAEIYLASLVVVDQTTTMERAYLEELARQLRLPAALKADLEGQASAL